MSKVKPGIVVKKSDYNRLLSLIEAENTDATEALERELNRAKLVEDRKLPSDVVAMGSSVTFKQKEKVNNTIVTLVFPNEANLDEMKISVLSPVGSALIGLRVGGEIDWPVPGNKTQHFEVIEVSQALGQQDL